jgi:serine phosphatase RsbU (regulator of sigma subunit)
LQASLLPAEFPLAPGLDFAAYFAPMGDGNEVGGDFYDVFPKEAGYTALVGDVCGKGPEAARLTALCRYTLRAAGMGADAGPGGTLALLNRAILEQAPEAGFCTVVIADLAPTSHDTMSATISTGGHPPPLVIRSTGEVEELPVRGCVLGAIEEPQLANIVVELAAGDALMFVTDGVEETRRADGAFYGYERVRQSIEQALRSGGGATAAALIDAVRSDLDEFRGDQSPRDDVVILAVRFEGP